MKCPSGDSEEPRDDEELARVLLGEHLSGELVRVDPPLPDFVICRDGVIEGGVEVTRATDEDSERLRGLLRKDGPSFESDRLEQNWIVMFNKGADLRKLNRDRLVDALVLMELDATERALAATNRQIQQRHALEAIRHETQIKGVLGTLGVDHAIPWNHNKPAGTVHLSEGGWTWAWEHPNLINDLAEEVIERKKEKGLRSISGESHLFVWVDPWEPTGAGILMSGQAELPEEPPKIPDWVTDVWMVSTFGPARLWHCSRGGSWHLRTSGQPDP